MRLEVTATADNVVAEKPDAVILATGAGPAVCAIPGADSDAVTDYARALTRPESLGEHVVIVGGGNIGCETADYLLTQGKRVTILEMLYRIADQVEIATRNCLIKALGDGGAEMIPGATVTGIRGGTVSYTLKGAASEVSGDNIVIAIGCDPASELATALRGLVLDLRIVGDARQPRQIIHAVTEGFYAAYQL